MANSGKKARKQSSNRIVDDQYMNHECKEVKPLNFIQGEYLEAIRNNDIIFGIGSAGTGKTFIAANYAANVSYFVEQVKGASVDGFRYRVIFRPETIIPDPEIQTSGD